MRSPRQILFAFWNGCVRDIIPIYPLYAVMFIDHGVSPLGLSVLLALWATVAFVFEIPSGAWADRFSRKWLIVIGAVIKGAAFIAWWLRPDFFGFALGFFFWGFGSTLRSGAWEALLHDTLKSWGREQEFGRRYGQATGLATFGVVIADLAGGLLIVFGYDFVLLVSAIVPIVSIVPMLIWVDDIRPDDPDTSSQNQRYVQVLASGLSEATRNRTILYIVLAFSLLIVTFGAWDEYVSPTLDEKGMSLSAIAYLVIPVYLSLSAGYALAHRAQALRLDSLLAILAASTVPLCLLPLIDGYWLPVATMPFFFTFGMASTLFQTRLQHEIEGGARATVSSIASFGENVGNIAWFGVIGVAASVSSYAAAALVTAVLTIALCAVFLLLARRWGLSSEPFGAVRPQR